MVTMNFETLRDFIALCYATNVTEDLGCNLLYDCSQSRDFTLAKSITNLTWKYLMKPGDRCLQNSLLPGNSFK